VLMAPAMGGRRGLGSNEITLAQERPPQGDPQTPQGIHFTGLEAMLSTDRMWRSRLFGGTRTPPSLPERDFLGVSLVIRGFRDRNTGAARDICNLLARHPSGKFPITLRTYRAS